MAGRPTYNRRGGASRAAGGLAQLDRALAGPPPGSPLEWVEDTLLWEIIFYVEGHKKRRIEGLDQRLQRLYPGVPGMRMLCHHETDSRKTKAGWLDLFIAGPGGQLSAECKTEAKRRRVTPGQNLWLDVLGLNGFPAYLWTPADWVAGAIQAELERLARPPVDGPRAAMLRELSRAPRYGCGCFKSGAHVCEVWGGGSG